MPPLQEELDYDPIEAECKSVLQLLVHCVAMQHVTAEQETLLAELEDYQEQCWTRDELPHRQRMRGGFFLYDP